LRSRVLTAGNSAIRDLHNSCRNYNIIYNPTVNEVINYDDKEEKE
jgi:hypothetical protein